MKKNLEHQFRQIVSLFWTSARGEWKGLANRRSCPSAVTLYCRVRRGRLSKYVLVNFCSRNVEKLLMLLAAWTDHLEHGGPPGFVHADDLARYIFRLTPSTSEAETQARPTACATLSRHEHLVAMLLLSPKNGV